MQGHKLPASEHELAVAEAPHRNALDHGATPAFATAAPTSAAGSELAMSGARLQQLGMGGGGGNLLAAGRAGAEVTASDLQAFGTAFAALKGGPLSVLDNGLAALYYANSAQAGRMSSFISSNVNADALVAGANGHTFVVVDCDAKDGDGAALLKQLQAAGLQYGSAYKGMASGLIDTSKVGALVGVTDLASAHTAFMDKQVGTVTSQADAAQHADDARATYGVDGSGIVVGVLSDSFDKATGAATHMAGDILTDDLPVNTVVVQDATSGTDEGRAMAQLIHDIAPGAIIDFATSGNLMADMYANIAAESAGRVLATRPCNMTDDRAAAD